MEITEAALSDVPALVALVNNAYRGETSKKGWTTEADFLDGIRVDEDGLTQLINSVDSTILKYVEGGEILACVHLQDKQDDLYLGMLTVSPELQGKGIGKALLNAAEKVAKDKRRKAIVMTVITLRTELISWYERHGYSRTGNIVPFPNDPRFGIPKQPLEFEVLRKQT